MFATNHASIALVFKNMAPSSAFWPLRGSARQVIEIEAPVVNDDQVLVRIHAAGLHAGDCFTVRGGHTHIRTCGPARTSRCG